MVGVSLQAGFALYVFVSLGMLCVLALVYFVRSINREWALSEEKLCLCSKCNCTFVVDRSASAARCPRCKSLNRGTRR